MTTFFIIRHGKTLFNEKERLQGWCDSPLTADGFAQMKQLSEGLKDIDFSAIYTSTSPRAMTCAEILAEDRDLELQPRDSLREIGYGSLEGEYLADAFPEGRSVTVLKHDNNRFSLDCLPDISWRTNTGFSNR